MLPFYYLNFNDTFEPYGNKFENKEKYEKSVFRKSAAFRKSVFRNQRLYKRIFDKKGNKKSKKLFIDIICCRISKQLKFLSVFEATHFKILILTLCALWTFV